MKRAAAVLLTLALMLSLTACMSRGSMQLKRADRYFDDLRGAFKMSDVTNSAKLIGKRENNGKDWFTGSYTAQCENETGRDTVFGGASARDRRIKVKAYIKTETGSAVIRLRMNGRATKFLPTATASPLSWTWKRTPSSRFCAAPKSTTKRSTPPSPT